MSYLDRVLPDLITEWIRLQAKREVEALILNGAYLLDSQRYAEEQQAKEYNNWVSALRGELTDKYMTLRIDISGFGMSPHEMRRLRVLAQEQVNYESGTYVLEQMIRADVDEFLVNYKLALTEIIRTYKRMNPTTQKSN